MKNLIINIFKTLFFFDLAVIIISLLPQLKSENVALLKLMQEALTVTVPLFLSIVFYRFVEKRQVGVPVGKKKFKSAMKGLGIGFLIAGICVGLFWALGFLKFTGFGSLKYIYFWLGALLCSAIAEELLLRGYLFNLYRTQYGLLFATVVTTMFFLSLNLVLFSKPKIYIAVVILLNILLCLLLDCTNSVFTTIFARFMYTAISCLLFGGLYSNQGYPVILKTAFSGKELFNGSIYKLEGSLITFIVLSVILLLTLIKKYALISHIKKLIRLIKFGILYTKKHFYIPNLKRFRRHR